MVVLTNKLGGVGVGGVLLLLSRLYCCDWLVVLFGLVVVSDVGLRLCRCCYCVAKCRCHCYCYCYLAIVREEGSMEAASETSLELLKNQQPKTSENLKCSRYR